MMARPATERLIRHLGLVPLPVEGGYFRETYRSTDAFTAAGPSSPLGKPKSLSTAIYFLLTSEPDSFSALHKLPTDEIYHFYLGDPVELLLLHSGGRSERVILGHGVFRDQRVQFVAPRGAWQGSRLIPGGEFALLGTTMAPGFDVSDYVPGDRDALVSEFPSDANLIRQLTRR